MSAILAGSTHKVALIGNPNVGKSTLFNGLTGMRQHTGNWPGKTVQLSAGTVRFAGEEYTLIDLPGTYSLTTLSEDEKVTREYLMSGEAEAVIVVADATALERNLILVMQVLRERTDVVVAVNLLDEARRKGISIDLQRLEGLLGVPVVGTEARNGIGFRELMAACKHVVERRQVAAHSGASEPPVPEPSSLRFRTMNDEQIVREAEAMAAQVVHKTGRQTVDWDTWLDNILTSRWLGFPAMFLLLGVLLWITVAGANVPSEWLATVLFSFESVLSSAMHAIGAPDWLHGFLVLGVYRGVAWVVSVMLPPMAIFFPLFTLLEDLGYLPRIAFNLDPLFTRSGGQGRQALTMAMGLGCNAAGVISCRIIDSPRERMIAILTNNFVPCNGRWPMLFTLASLFMGGAVAAGYSTLLSTATVAGMVLVGLAATLLVSWVLSKTLLKGYPSSFTLELPPYRVPKVGQVLVRSVFDRTLFVLRRAVIVAAPAGGITWILANIYVGEMSIMHHVIGWFEPLGYLMGMDGTLLVAFLLGLPANEIVLPIALMGYLSAGQMIEVSSLATLREIFVQNGWTWLTALNTMLFAVLHFPCGTTLLTIRKETGSTKWTLLAAFIPLFLGVVVTTTVAAVVRYFGWV